MKNTEIAALSLLAALVSPAMAQDSGVSFGHKNWELACDNTNTCRAAGYANEDEPSDSNGSVLLTRIAGPGTVPTGEVTLADYEGGDSAPVAKLTLWINGKAAGALKPTKDGNWNLSASQTLALIGAIKGSGTVEFKGGPAPFVLSGDGASATLLKMDDVQGRIGTPGALTKKGDKPESSVPAAIPAPVIQAVKVPKAEERPLTAPEIAALTPKLLATLKPDDCDRMQSPQDNDGASEDGITLTPLGNGHALITAVCWRAAYNEGYGYWVIDSALKQPPVLVTNSGSGYDEGIISMGQKGRGLGDCWATASWVWDGTAFRQSNEATTGLCRLIHAGGTWDLPTYVAEVKAAQ
ncbi:DUF1176 domain-containing protein [Serratia fonticola]|uniref:DUF1176 domain-containing protein n=1 Tax=Serratia fonticola TaxID=47917 RepID=A0AAJ1YAQ5_SERFO|nr:DUF1176 domain-containing protein [Serratia fonticola]MDQ9127116.1 DUF1176 domain-containing protein [Serratia fonticola]CAI2084251.1 Protein of uncharacterised function (DUF1176) [Serratia fonticola]